MPLPRIFTILLAVAALLLAVRGAADDVPATPQERAQVAAPALNEPPPPLQILAVDEPPMSFIDGSGVVVGLGIEALRELQRRTWNNDPVHLVPEARAWQAAATEPRVVLIGFSRTREREEQFHWVVPLMRKPWVVYGPPGSTRSLPDVESLRALGSIAVVSGDVRQRWLASREFTNLWPAVDHDQAVGMLLAGRADALFSEPQGVAWYCKLRGCLRGVPVPLLVAKRSEVYILMSRNGIDEQTALRWKAAGAAMIADGTIAALARRWGEYLQWNTGVRSQFHRGLLEICVSERDC
jgi:polar amino acid transport system substrate-binding protein